MPLGKVLTPLAEERFGRRGEVAENLLARMRAAATSGSTFRGGHATTIGGKLREYGCATRPTLATEVLHPTEIARAQPRRLLTGLRGA